MKTKRIDKLPQINQDKNVIKLKSIEIMNFECSLPHSTAMRKIFFILGIYIVTLV